MCQTDRLEVTRDKITFTTTFSIQYLPSHKSYQDPSLTHIYV